MIICPKNKFIFVHIPKTAGTSLETVLQRFLDPESGIHITNGRDDLENRKKLAMKSDQRLQKHSTANSVHRSLGDQYNDYFSFAFVRNPYARANSAFHFLRIKARLMLKNTRVRAKREKTGGPDISRFIDMTFEEMCQNWEENAQGIGMFRPQTTWLPKNDSVKFVGHVENLADDFATILDKVGIGSCNEIEIPEKNRKTEKNSWRSMSGAAIEVIQKHYAEDFERFGYSKEIHA